MNLPAVHGQLPPDQDGTPAGVPVPGDLADTGSGPAARPPVVPAATWRRAAITAAAGVPLGLLWWILAPSGLNLLSGNPELRSGANTQGWLPRDLVLAGLFLLAGCLSGAIASGGKRDRPQGRDVFPAVAAAALGALAAWGTGVLCGLWWGTPGDTSASASIAFSLRSPAVLVIWPAASALAIFLSSLFARPAP